jgi:cytoskeletal protein CcmA (bactofilin family)
VRLDRGGSVSGDIVARGHFKTADRLEYGEMAAFGRIDLPGGSHGKRLVALGRVDFSGDSSCLTTLVRGMVRVDGNYSGETINVTGKLEVAESLNVSKSLEVSGVAEVSKRIECQSLVVGGKLTGETVNVKGHAEVVGEIRATRGLRCKSAIVRKGSRVTGSLVAQRVEVGNPLDTRTVESGTRWTLIGQMTRVDDLFAETVKIGPYSRAGRVYAEAVEMMQGSIADQVTYTKELKLPSNYHLERPPERVSRLPDPPI